MPKEDYRTPGVYLEEAFIAPPERLHTGVPVFLGFAQTTPDNPDDPRSLALIRWPEFEQKFGEPVADSYLAPAVHGFFENGGELCYVIPLEGATQPMLDKALSKLEAWDEIDLVCAPDIMTNAAEATALQQRVLDHCEKTNDRMAILDALPNAAVQQVLDQQQQLSGINGALYYPWVRVPGGTGSDILMPPCGHVAGIYARSDRRIGVHKAPANELLEGVLDLEFNLTHSQQAELNPNGVNCLRVFPGRGIRVWGARTLSQQASWIYVNVRRLFLTAGRWIERNTPGAVFEPNDSRLWARITRDLTAYFNELFRQGALKGRTAQEAFYVKCNAETNPAEVRDLGMVVTEIGLAPGVPNEFVVVHIIHGANGVQIAGPG